MAANAEAQLKREKEVARYSAAVHAWFTTRLEADKTITAISAGGIGLIITLATTVGVRHWLNGVSYLLACVAFTVTIVSCIWIFKRNADYLMSILKGDVVSDPRLKQLDRFAVLAFMAGIFFAGISATPFADIDRFFQTFF